MRATLKTGANIKYGSNFQHGRREIILIKSFITLKIPTSEHQFWGQRDWYNQNE